MKTSRQPTCRKISRPHSDSAARPTRPHSGTNESFGRHAGCRQRRQGSKPELVPARPHHTNRQRGMRYLPSTIPLSLVPCLIFEQPATPARAFEAASIKVSPPIRGQNTGTLNMQIDSGRVRYTNVGLGLSMPTPGCPLGSAGFTDATSNARGAGWPIAPHTVATRRTGVQYFVATEPHSATFAVRMTISAFSLPSMLALPTTIFCPSFMSMLVETLTV